MIFYIIITQFLKLITCQTSRDPGSSGYTIAFLLNGQNLLPTNTPYMNLQLSNNLGLIFSKIQEVRFQNIAATCSTANTSITSSINGNIISIGNPFTQIISSSKIQCSDNSQIFPSLMAVQLIGTFQYGGSITINAYYSNSQYQTTTQFGSQSSVSISPDQILDADVSFTLQTSLSQVISQQGSYTLNIKTPTLSTKINQIILILPMYWYPDQAVPAGCIQTQQPTNFSSTVLTLQSASVTADNSKSQYQVTLTFSDFILNGQNVMLSFQMINPYTAANIVVEGQFLTVQASFNYFTSASTTTLTAFYTNFTKTNINAQSQSSSDCNINGNAQIQCSSTQSGTYSSAACLSGQTMFVKIVVNPPFFQDVYSSVQFTLSNIPPNQSSISSIKMQIISPPSTSTDLGFNIASTVNSNNQVISFPQYLKGTYIYQSFPFICMASSYAQQLSVIIPNFQLPYDVDGLNVSAQFFVQPFLSADKYAQYQRDTSASSILNFQCGNTQLKINQNILSQAQVKTVNAQDLQVGATQATHIFRIVSNYNFISTTGKIQLTLPSSLSINPSGTFSCTASLIQTNSQLLALTVTSCSYTGTPVVVTLSYSQSGTQAGTGFEFSINQVVNPVVIQSSGNFQVSTFLRGGSISDTNDSNQSFAFQTQAAPFTTSNIINNCASTKFVYQFCPYALTLVSPVALGNGNQIVINFPTYVSEINTISVTSPSSLITVTSSNNQVPLILSITGSISAGITITIVFTIRNPPVSNLDYSFSVKAQTSTNSVFLQSSINYGSADSITRTTFSSFQVTSSSQQNLDSNAVFSVSFTPNVLLQSTSTMILAFNAPTTTHNFLKVGSTTCSAVTSGLILSCTLNSPQNNQLTVSITNTIQPSTSYQFNISNILNYISLAPYQIKGNIGYLSTQIGNESTQNLSNSQILNLSSVTLSIQNYILGEQSQYQFQINNVSPFPTSGSILITTTTLVTFSNPSTVNVNSSTCSGTFSSSQLNLSCFPNQDTSTITIQAVNNPKQLVQQTNTPFVITLSEIVNGNSYAIKQYTSNTLIYTNQCNISSFCRTCQSNDQSNCISCYPSNTIQYQSTSSYVQEVILNNVPSVKTCVATCPAQSYLTSSGGQSVCAPCSSTCATCVNSPNNCTSCSGNLYLDILSNTCGTTCPDKYFKGSNNLCQLCSTAGFNCLTCTSASFCASCDTGRYLQNSSCVTQCDSNYYLGNGGKQCLNCPTGCNTCTSATNCTSCSVGYIKFQTTCVQNCPTGYSKLIKDGSYYCGLCDTICQSCENLSTTCTSCYPQTYLYNQNCIQKSQIPSQFYGDDSTWTVQSCMPYCDICSYKTLCTKCSSSAVIYQGVCYTSCPSQVPEPDGNGGCKEAIIPAAISEDSSKVVPFPMLLSCIAFCISVYFSKYEKPQTFVPGCIVGFCALFEWISWLILIYICVSKDGVSSLTTIAAILGFAFIYLFNLAYFILYKKIISQDSSFIEWQLQSKNRICKNTSIILASLISFKMQKILFCKYFNQNFFKAKLKDIDLFTPFNKISFMSIIFNSLLIILSASVFCYRYQNSTQVYLLSLDALLVTLFMVIFMIWEALKNEAFFEETYNFNFEQMSQFTQRFFPFDQSYMERARQRSVYGHLRHSESNSSLVEFGRDNKVTKSEQIQQPYSQVMDPNDISTNAAIDRNVLNNSSNGAPYVIQDQICESSKPGKKRQFEKKHLAPIFDHKNFPPIIENSLEDEEFYDDDDMQNQSMKKMVGQGFNKNGIIQLGDQQDIENQRNNNFNKQNEFRNSISNNRGDQIPSKLGQSHTIYYDQQDKYGMRNVSMGVDIQEDEHSEDGEEISQNLYSQQQNEKSFNQKAQKLVGSSLISGQVATLAAAAAIGSKKNNDNKDSSINKDGVKSSEINKNQTQQQSSDNNSKLKSSQNVDNSSVKEVSGAAAINKTGNNQNDQSQVSNQNGKSSGKDSNQISENNNQNDKNNNKIDQNQIKNDTENNLDNQNIIANKNGDKIDENYSKEEEESNQNKNSSKIDESQSKKDENQNKAGKDNNKDKQNNDSAADKKNHKNDEKNDQNKDNNNNKTTDKESNSKEGQNDKSINSDQDKNKQASDGEDMLFYYNHPEKDQNDNSKNNQQSKDQSDNKDGNNNDNNRKTDATKGENNKKNSKEKKNLLGTSDDEGANSNSKKIEGKSQKPNDVQISDENKVERIMPVIEDLDADLQNQDSNEIKDKKFISPEKDRNLNSQKVKAPQKNSLFGTLEEDKANENQKNKNSKTGKSDINQIYDSDESLHTASEGEVNFNEISPSDFNILNQRYEENFLVQGFQPVQSLDNQLIQQSLGQLNRNVPSSQSQALMNNTRNISSKPPQSKQKQQGLQQSTSNVSVHNINQLNDRNGLISSANQLNQARNSLSQNQSRPVADKNHSTQYKFQGQSNNFSQANSNDNGNLDQDLQNSSFIQKDQLFIQNFDDINKSYSQTAKSQDQQQNQFFKSFKNQDSQISFNQVNRGNMSSRSKGNSPSNSNITYKIPTVDINKLKGLEKIYLQRIETNVHSSQNSRKNIAKKKKKKIQRQLTNSSNFQANSMQGDVYQGGVSEIYFGEKGQRYDPTILDPNNEEVLDLDPEEDYMPENLDFDQNF